jgi:hypothetical protein
MNASATTLSIQAHEHIMASFELLTALQVAGHVVVFFSFWFMK